MSALDHSDGEEIILEIYTSPQDNVVENQQLPSFNQDRMVVEEAAPANHEPVVVAVAEGAARTDSRSAGKTAAETVRQAKTGNNSGGNSREVAKNKRKLVESATSVDELLQDGYQDILDSRVRVLAGVASCYELCVWQHPVTYVSRQDQLGVALMDDYLSHAAKRIDQIRHHDKLGPNPTKELAKYLDTEPFTLKKASVQWAGIIVGPHHYRHAPVFDFWAQNRGRIPAHIEELCELLRLKFLVRIRELNTVLAMKTFGLTKDIRRDPNARGYNPFRKEFTAPKPGSYDEVCQELATAQKEVEKAKSLAKTRQELEKEVAKLQSRIKEINTAKQVKRDAEAQHKLVKLQLEESYKKEALWSTERNKMQDEIRRLKGELEQQKGKSQYLKASDVEKMFRQFLPAETAGTSMQAKRSRNSESQTNGSDTENRRRSPSFDSDRE